MNSSDLEWWNFVVGAMNLEVNAQILEVSRAMLQEHRHSSELIKEILGVLRSMKGEPDDA